MAKYRYIGVGKETEYQTAVSAVRFTEGTARMPHDPNIVMPAPTLYRDPVKFQMGSRRTSGDIIFPAEPENILGDMILGVLGSVESTPGYVHSFLPADSLPTYTVRLGAEFIERIFAGCFVNGLTIRGGTGKDVEASAKILQGFTEATFDDELSEPSMSPLQAFNMAFRGSGVPISYFKYDTTDIGSRVYDWAVDINNNIPIEKTGCTSPYFAVKRVGQRDVTGKISMFFDSNVERDDFLAGTTFALDLRVYQTSSAYLRIVIPKCLWEKNMSPDVVPQNEPLIIDAPFRCFKATDLPIMQLLLGNSIASY